MSIPESCTAPTLEDILAMLAMRLELEEAIAKLPLTQALEQCLLLTQINDSPYLAEFINQELTGYSSQPPSYRYVHLSYFDTGGQFINGINQYNNYPVITGVCKLERHLKNGLTLMLPKQILAFLSQVSGCEVDIGHISPTETQNLLETIRHQVIHKITMNLVK
ncbi:MAG: hypothetical protein LH649_17505 [Pseudanabaena sp. CAN_BIN31]|nr:hypothetical protein [Pseudanabaena sp. CAN_BIN31]